MTTTHLHGDCRDILPTLPAASVQTVVTSPPYFGLRDYGAAGQIGLEPTPAEYVAALVAVFREVRRVLRDDGTLWLNLGDSYAGSTQTGGTSSKEGSAKRAGRIEHAPRPESGIPNKSLMGIPWRVALALQDDGWWLRSDIIWHKPNAMPESVTDRPTRAHEYVFLLAKSARYYYDAAAVAEAAQEQREYPTWEQRKADGEPLRRGDPGQSGHVTQWAGLGGNGITRNRRTVWTIPTQPYSGAHFAVMPEQLAEVCIRASSRPGDMVLDPFGGSGTVGRVALRLQRRAVLIDLNADYIELQNKRTNGVQLEALL